MRLGPDRAFLIAWAFVAFARVALYADAIPLDLLKAEQDRIANERVQAEALLATSDAIFDAMRSRLDEALALTASCWQGYRRAGDRDRDRMNRTFFTKIYIENDQATGADLAPPFAQILDDDLEEAINDERT